MTIRITFNSNDIDLLVGPNGLDTIYRSEYKRQQSGSGKAETINLYGIQKFSFDARFTESVYRSLIAWWSWARQGKSWSVAMDSSNTGDTIFADGPWPAGSQTIHLYSTAAFAANDVCIIKGDSSDDYEIVVIDHIINFESLYLTAGTKFAYETGDIFRHIDYFPDVISTDNKFNPKKGGDYYSWTFNFMENL